MASKNVFSFFESDSDEECCCGGAGALAQKKGPIKKGSIDMEWLEEQILRKRFWPYPADQKTWPCQECYPLFCEEKDFWECAHGKWLWVDSWEEVPALPEEHSLAECRGAHCSGHGLLTGEILAMHLATEVGLWWGDILLLEEEARLAAETPQEKAARLVAAAKKDAEMKRAAAERQKRLAEESIVRKSAPQNRRYDRRTGKPMPCKFFCHGGVVGAEWPAENGWESGCGMHKKGKCEFFHPDEPEWQIILGKAPAAPSRPQTPEMEWRTVGSRPSSAGSGHKSRW